MKRFGQGAVLALVLASSMAFGRFMEKYGTVVTYAEKQKIVYPDFSITYLGQKLRRYSGPPRDVDESIFEVNDGAKKTEISWGASGKAVPTEFKAKGKAFVLELKSKPNEMIVWTKEEFAKRKT